MKKDRNIAFIVELLLLFIILLFVIVVITQTFMKSRSQSLYARHLTEAVTLAEEVAEVSAAAEDIGGASDLLAKMEQVLRVSSEAEDRIFLEMEFSAGSGARDNYRVEIDWQEEPAGADAGSGTDTDSTAADAGSAAGVGSGAQYISKQIRVYFEDEDEPVYTLDSGIYNAAS